MTLVALLLPLSTQWLGMSAGAHVRAAGIRIATFISIEHVDKPVIMASA